VWPRPVKLDLTPYVSARAASVRVLRLPKFLLPVGKHELRMDICVAIYERWTKEVDLNKLLDPDWEAKWNASRNAGANSTSAGGMSINFTEHLVNVSYARTAPSCASHFVSVTVVADYE
jgi:hypothetical protein